MSKERRPAPVRTLDEFGMRIVRVALDEKGARWATVDETDFDRLAKNGVGTTWRLVGNGKGTLYVRIDCSQVIGRMVVASRVIMEAGPRDAVRFWSGDRTDLRRRNLYMASGGAKRSDAVLARRDGALAAT